MKKISFGNSEKQIPSLYCDKFNYENKPVKYPIEKIKFSVSKRGCVLSFPLNANEQLYGMGLQLKCFNLRGRKITVRPNADATSATGDSHAPVPFFVSTAGYGIYFDTARYAEFYFGSSEKLEKCRDNVLKNEIKTSVAELYGGNENGNADITVFIPEAEGIDIYIFEGKTITDVVCSYNLLSGGGCNVSDWALLPIYRCYAKDSQQKVIERAKYFREKDLSFGIIGLEPGWQTHTYSCSYLWNKELFPNPDEMISELHNDGYRVNLWEHAFVDSQAPFYYDIIPYSGDYAVWKGAVPDFSVREAAEIFCNHHKKLTAQGIDGFKLDECDSSDFTGCWSFPNHSHFPSGLDGEQYHSLFGTLYMKTVMKVLNEGHLSQVRNAGALAASYPFVLYSDLYNHKEFVRGNCVSGFCGLLWTPEVRDAKTKEEFLCRLQTNVFSVQALVNAWYCEDYPWKDFDCEAEVKQLLDERIKLLPILKKAFYNYNKYGIPPVRALVSDYTDDSETYFIDDEYLLGEDLLAAPAFFGENERKVYLPEGNWEDYFTGKSIESGWHTVKGNSISVYRKKL